GRFTSTPPCRMGAVMMKITSSTKATSTRLVTLISARTSSPSRRRRPRLTLDPPLARQRPDELAREPLDLAGEQVHLPHEVVVGQHGRDGDEQPRHGR